MKTIINSCRSRRRATSGIAAHSRALHARLDPGRRQRRLFRRTRWQSLALQWRRQGLLLWHSGGAPTSQRSVHYSSSVHHHYSLRPRWNWHAGAIPALEVRAKTLRIQVAGPLLNIARSNIRHQSRVAPAAPVAAAPITLGLPRAGQLTGLSSTAIHTEQHSNWLSVVLTARHRSTQVHNRRSQMSLPLLAPGPGRTASPGTTAPPFSAHLTDIPALRQKVLSPSMDLLPSRQSSILRLLNWHNAPLSRYTLQNLRSAEGDWHPQVRQTIVGARRHHTDTPVRYIRQRAQGRPRSHIWSDTDRQFAGTEASMAPVYRPKPVVLTKPRRRTPKASASPRTMVFRQQAQHKPAQAWAAASLEQSGAATPANLEATVSNLVRQQLDQWQRKRLSPRRLATQASRAIERELVRERARMGI